MTRIPTNTGLELGHDRSGDAVLCYTPSDEQLAPLLTMPGAVTVRHKVPCVGIPWSREAVLAAEGIGVPERASIGYRKRRSRTFEPSGAEWQAVLKARAEIPLCELARSQFDFSAFAYPRHAVWNASQTGTGRVRSAWHMADLWQSRRVVILCPPGRVAGWANTYRDMLGTRARLRVLTLDRGSWPERSDTISRAAELPEPCALVIPITEFAALSRAMPRFDTDCLIVKPGLHLSSSGLFPGAVRGLASNLLRRAPARRGRVLLIDSAPLTHDPPRLHSRLSLLNLLLPAEDLSWFEKNIATGGGIHDLEVLIGMLKDVWYRDTHAVLQNGRIMPAIPPPREERVPITLGIHARRHYDRVKECGAGPALLSLVAGGHLRVGNGPDGRDVFDTIPSAKLSWLRYWARERLLPDPTLRAVIWCAHPEEEARVVKELTDELGAPAVTWPSVSGGGTMNPHAFASRGIGRPQVLVAPMPAAGLLGQLVNADFHILYSPCGDAFTPKIAPAPGSVIAQLYARDTIEDHAASPCAEKDSCLGRL